MSVFLNLSNADEAALIALMKKYNGDSVLDISPDIPESKSKGLTPYLRAIINWTIRTQSRSDVSKIIDEEFLGNAFSFLDACISRYIQKAKSEK